MTPLAAHVSFAFRLHFCRCRLDNNFVLFGIEVKGKTQLELFFTLLNINTVDATLKLGHTSQL